MIGFSVHGAAQVAAKLNHAAASLNGDLRKTMTAATISVEAALRKRMRGQKGTDPFWGVTGARGDTLGMRSGAAQRSITRAVLGTGLTVTGVVGSPSKALAAHEHDTVIKPRKSGGYLRIPTAAAQKRSGEDRYIGMSARQIPGTFIWPNKAQRAARPSTSLWIARSAAGSLQKLYLLKQSITLRGRGIFRLTAAGERPKIDALFKGAVALTVRKAS